MRRFLTLPIALIGLLACQASSGSAAESASAAESVKASATLPPYSERGGEETPDFRRHVLPLLGRLGCNGRSCHGSFQGQGGFRLSLFGYDFKADHDALIGGTTPRTDLADAAKSLILQKPTMAVDHDGGERMKADSWQYRLLKTWIEKGAKPLAAESAEFSQLVITPTEINFANPAETRQVKVVAHWADGTSEDVTSICRFRSNDESICKIDENGLVTSIGRGDTHVVAFYDNGVVTLPVLMPITEQFGDKYPTVAAPTKIDQLVVAKLRKLGVTQSELSTDAEFLRRVSLDITGTLPTSNEVREFLANTAADKRARKIDELLERPGYAAWWATKLCDITGNNSVQLQGTLYPQGGGDGNVLSAQWYNWIYQRLVDNRPYDEIVEGLVLAKSRPAEQTYEEYVRLMTDYSKADPEKFAHETTMPFYWARKNVRKPDDMALGFAYTFLGVRMQCAQCHKHPFDQWTKNDFDQFTTFFNRVTLGVNPTDRKQYADLLETVGLKGKNGVEARKVLAELAKEGTPLPAQEVFVAPARKPDAPRQGGKNRKNQKEPVAPAPQLSKLLGGPKVDLSTYDDPRQALMDWMRSDPTKFFARAIVNRVWANYFNVGIIDPPDDLNLANPPSNGPLLDYLTQAFVDHKYDLKWLHREITLSRTYQLSWQPNASNSLDNKNFSRAVPRRMPAEIAYDALVMSTAGDVESADLNKSIANRSIGPNFNVVNRNGGGRASYALAAFGKPARAVNCDCERSDETSLLQTIYLRNDADMYALLDRSTGFIKQLDKQLNPKPAKAAKAAVSPKDRDGDTVEVLERRLAAAIADGRLGAVEKIQRRLDRAKAEAGNKDGGNKDAGNKDTAKSDETKIAAEKVEPAQPGIPTADEIVNEVYLRTLSRLPTASELDRSKQHLAESTTLSLGARELMWALLNTKEFIVNH